ncbi:uncharacterized protein LOC111709482 isoform X2 [Eurytemora carolleeae]|uniref:uncharacterized protein LOC111709482 isoform X2 n=1 Tax=Eurytemora carolleeae TaxID=1294199 RepID=UPI000C784D58|nr:uncharacterized protein LOC111709482 isoform X2 [Eurytemora carolleeae]|eukprot:XP_023338919.1 uncharacterized protein LOC111709482 isoform X2 [Eurytemora affinis]
MDLSKIWDKDGSSGEGGEVEKYMMTRDFFNKPSLSDLGPRLTEGIAGGLDIILQKFLGEKISGDLRGTERLGILGVGEVQGEEGGGGNDEEGLHAGLRHLLGYSSRQSNYYYSRMPCQDNCSGHGECLNGSCYCMIQYEGLQCDIANFSYHVAFTSIFSLMALTSLIQLGMCIHAEYLRQKSPSFCKALRITTQKLLYFLVFLASSLRALYFASPKLDSSLSASLMSAYYPVLLSGASLVVCFWAEVFHLESIRWDRPRFLSKSFLGFVTFNIITYSLLIAELLMLWFGYEDVQYYTHIFNGCYAGLMFIVVVFFLIYGVEVFFKVRGGFTVRNVPKIINSRRSPVKRRQSSKQVDEQIDEQKPMVETKFCGMIQSTAAISPADKIQGVTPSINTSQLHQSRFGLLAQALMMMVTIGFLFSETLSEFWKLKVDLSSRNTHVVIFRVMEIGIALWFPCVLWNCIRPEQLWILNPKKLITTFKSKDKIEGTTEILDQEDEHASSSRDSSTARSTGSEEGAECWICYDTDRTDAGSLIQPCACKGDMAAVHHDCLRRWLVESSDNPESLVCKVCKQAYEVERGSQFSLSQGFTTRHWIGTAGVVFVMMLAAGGCWAAVQIYSEAWIKCLAVGLALLVQYICLRFLGLNTVTAYQRAKVYGLKIMNRSLNRNPASTSLESRECNGAIIVENAGDCSIPGPSGVSAFRSEFASNNFPRHFRREAPSITIKAQSHL